MLYAIRKYHSQRYNAKHRNIAFELTFEEWYQWWLQHGVDKSIPNHNRNTKNNLCMCRFNDIGPYRLDNIYCDTNSNNVKSKQPSRLGKTHTQEARAKISAAGKAAWAVRKALNKTL